MMIELIESIKTQINWVQNNNKTAFMVNAGSIEIPKPTVKYVDLGKKREDILKRQAWKRTESTLLLAVCMCMWEKQGRINSTISTTL